MSRRRLHIVASVLLLALLATAGVASAATACDELIANGSFEIEPFVDWQIVGSPWLGKRAYDGLLSGALGGSDNAEDQFYQQITLPASPDSATLHFWWYMETSESTFGAAWDYLYVEVRDLSDEVLQTLETQSNVSPADAWQESSIDLKEYPDLLGQTVRVAFRGASPTAAIPPASTSMS